MENYPSFVVMFNLFAIAHPRVASGLGLLWVVGRVMYHLGYSRAGPKGRLTGSYTSAFAGIALVCPPATTLTIYSSLERLLA